MRCHRESDSNAGADASPADAEGGMGRREGRERWSKFATAGSGRERNETTGARAAWRDEDRGCADEIARVPIPR